MSKILLISRDPVRSRMAAPGIRCAEMARELALGDHVVTLAVPHEPEIAIEGVRQVHGHSGTLHESAACADVVIIGGSGHHIMPAVRIPKSTPRVVDLSFPLVLEVLAVQAEERAVWPPPVAPQALIRRLAAYLLDSDLLLCASDQQRQFYLGCLAMVGRLSPTMLRADPALSNLLAVAPFGCPSSGATRTGPGLQGTVANVEQADYVLLWSGGLGGWYDPGTVVRAVAIAAQRLPNVRLVFMGANPSNAGLTQTTTSIDARTLAQDLGVLHRNVFFHDEWVPYEDRANWLLDADVAIVASPASLESELSVRTRFLDYVWSATPVICTRGGAYAELTERSGLGLVVAPGDVEAMSVAIVTMSQPAVRAEMRRRLGAIRPGFTWQKTLEPLLSYCANPTLAPDRGSGVGVSHRLHREALRVLGLWDNYRTWSRSRDANR